MSAETPSKLPHIKVLGAVWMMMRRGSDDYRSPEITAWQYNANILKTNDLSSPILLWETIIIIPAWPDLAVIRSLRPRIDHRRAARETVRLINFAILNISTSSAEQFCSSNIKPTIKKYVAHISLSVYTRADTAYKWRFLEFFNKNSFIKQGHFIQV